MSRRMSIIIPTYNRADSLPKVLSKLFSQQEMLEDVEVIIVDDGSTDGTKKIVTQFAEKSSLAFRYFYQTNAGSSAARNFGIEKAHGGIILFLDSDIIPSENLIYEHLKFHGKYPQDNFALRGTTKCYHGQLETVRFTEIGEAEEVNRKNDNVEYIELCWADFRSGNISVKKQFLLENGIFDEEMIVMVDVELGCRLGKKGLKLFHSNKAMGFHLHPVNREQYFRYAEKYGKSLAVWYFKTPDLKNDLLSVGKGYRYGFLTWKKPLHMCKYLLRLAIVSKFTVKLIIFLGNVFKRKQNKLFRFFYRQAYQYYRRRAFKRHLALIKKGRLQGGAK